MTSDLLAAVIGGMPADFAGPDDDAATTRAHMAPLHGHPLAAGTEIRMVEAGEKSGRLDEMLDNIADTYDDEVETMLAALTSLMEPLLMVFLGVVIGGIVIALFMPLFKMSSLVGNG